MSTTAKKHKTKSVEVQHSSLEVWDNPAQRAEDCRKVLSTGVPIIGGTEKYNKGLRAGAPDDVRLFLPPRSDAWLAVSRDLIIGTPETRYKNVLPSAPAIGDPHPYSSKGVWRVSFDTSEYGPITMLAGLHYLTKGRYFGQSQQDKPNCPIDHRKKNQEYAAAVVEIANEHTKAGEIVFITGDFNMELQKDDPFFGGPVKLNWNDVRRFPNTGHGCIVGIGRVTTDKRVSPARSSRVLKLGLNSDHQSFVAKYDIRVA